MTIHAAADGSALGNPGPAGWAWYIDDDHWAAGGWRHGTNNMGELKAVLDLLEQTAASGDHLHIYCDSKYTIDSITKWMAGWKRKGWKKGDGAPVKNLELMKALDLAMTGRSVEFEWVKGHAGHALNEKADQLANAAAARYQAGLLPESGPGFDGSTVTGPTAPAHDALFSFDEPSDDDLVSAGERRVRDGDETAAAALLHPEWMGIAAGENLTPGAPEDNAIQILRVETLSPDVKLVILEGETGLQSAVWVRTISGWRRRFSQR